MYSIDEIKEKVTPIAKAYGVERIYLFGSYARGEASEKSDLDFRVDKGKMRGLFQFGGFFNDLEAALKMPIDVVTTNSLDQKFLENIKEGEVLLYESERN